MMPVVTAPQINKQGVSPAVLVAFVALLLFVFAGGAAALLLRAYWSRPAETAQATPAPVPAATAPPASVPTATATPQQIIIVNQTAAPPAQPRPVAAVRFYGGSYPQGSSRALTDGELSGQGCWDLKIMRNEIYARRGYIFQTRDMIDYFSGQRWYRPVSRNVALSALEKRNVARIQSYENSYGCR